MVYNGCLKEYIGVLQAYKLIVLFKNEDGNKSFRY